MREYKYRELIWHNICKVSLDLKNKFQKNKSYRRDRLVQNIRIDDLGYEDLAPDKNIENGEGYLDALFWSINNENVKNIALTGPYGSGKSSIIQTYLSKYPSTKALSISLATFDLSKEENENFENEIELGILKQLFYKVDSNKIPQSRYRKIKSRYYKKYLAIVISVALFAILAFAFFLPEKLNDVINYVVKSGDYYGLDARSSYYITFIFVCIGICSITYLMKWTVSRFRVKEVNIAETATVADDKDENSIFDRSMDEIVYFFEATDYRVLFIEDLDRYENTRIFVKLRELNTILNNYDLIKRRIVFVYAIKDDMFKDEERTKFFDFIIPVIPIINSTNSGEILRKKLNVIQQKDGSYQSSLYNISSSYITMVSPFIEDMRILTNICNEFIVYKKTLNSLKLIDEEMFSMMIFKSLFPWDFSELEGERGIVKQAFEDKKKFIKTKQSSLENEIDEIEKILSSVEKEILKSVKDVKAALLNYLAGTEGPFNYCYIDGKTYYYHQIMNDNFDMSQLLTKGSIYVERYRGNGKRIDNLISDEQVKTYLKLIDNIKKSEGNRKDALRNRIVECNEEISEIQSYSLKKLIELYGTNVIFSDMVQCNKLLVFFLRKGYINENYADYINYFHPNSISKEEMNFVRGIRMQEAIGDYSYSIRNVEQVCNRLEPYEFKQVEVWNFDVVDYLITKQKNNEKCKELFIGLSREEKAYQFVKSYFDRKKNLEIFVNTICKYEERLWNKIVNDELINQGKKYEYLEYILQYADIEDIINQNNESSYILYSDDYNDEYEEEGVYDYEEGISSFIIFDEDSLINLSKVDENKMIKIIEELGIIFEKIKISKENKNIVNYIFENNYYEINMNMLTSLFDYRFPDKKVYLKTKNFTILNEVDYAPLMEQLSDTATFKKYVSEIVVKEETNIGEDIEAVEIILERLFDVDAELCKKVLNKEQVTWDDISECCKCSNEKKNKRKVIWDYVLQLGKVKVTWYTFVEYYNDYGPTDTLLEWLENSINQLVVEEKDIYLSDEYIKDIIQLDISVECFDKITKAYSIEEFDLQLTEFDSEKVDNLVRNKWVPFSLEYLKEINQVNPRSTRDYILNNKKEFFDNISEVEVNQDTVIELIRSGQIDIEEIINIIGIISSDDMNYEMANEILKLEVPIQKEYVESAWNLLEQDKWYQLLLNQICNYSLEEISSKLALLAPEYKNLSDLSKKHREYLPVDEYGYNQKLLDKLKEMDYLSSVKKDEYYEEDPTTHKKYIKKRFEVWVKKQF